jgi:hypothetical protein
MRQESTMKTGHGIYLGNRPSIANPVERLTGNMPAIPRQIVIGLILIIALLAFEIFNFDTTRYALEDLLGDANFMSVRWATILAIAFCSIDFAGLAHLFTPERGFDEPKEVWYLMGAWLLGATMNALMTWWAVSLTLLSHNLGNEVLDRAELLSIVPVFVAVLVWLTRILFIGAFSVAGDHLFPSLNRRPAKNSSNTTVKANPRAATRQAPIGRAPKRAPVAERVPPVRESGRNRRPGNRQPRPGAGRRMPVTPVAAKGRRSR